MNFSFSGKNLINYIEYIYTPAAWAKSKAAKSKARVVSTSLNHHPAAWAKSKAAKSKAAKSKARVVSTSLNHPLTR